MQSQALVNSFSRITDTTHSVIWVRSKEYKPLVMSELCNAVKRAGHMTLTIGKNSKCEEQQAQCATSFLGQVYYYVIGDIQSLTKKKAQSWERFLHTYRGPHTLLFGAPASFMRKTSHCLVIDLPDTIDKQSVNSIINGLYSHHAKKMTMFLSHVWNYTSVLPLESLCLLVNYMHVVGKLDKNFIEIYIPQLISKDYSLFTLSQFFLQKNAEKFYELWGLCSSHYATTFWISFWADTLWRASCFVRAMKNGNRDEAYAIGKKRLPFSFTQNTWRNISSSKLDVAHHMLYTIDFSLKNGGNHQWLEFFYMQWFNGIV